MSFRRVFQIITIAFALAFTFTATSADTALACDPQTSGGYC